MRRRTMTGNGKELLRSHNSSRKGLSLSQTAPFPVRPSVPVPTTLHTRRHTTQLGHKMRLESLHCAFGVTESK